MKYLGIQQILTNKLAWTGQAHKQASTVVMTVHCIMEAWNKRNPLTEHYFGETTRLLTCLNLFYYAFQKKVENEKQKIEMENGCPPSAYVLTRRLDLCAQVMVWTNSISV